MKISFIRGAYLNNFEGQNYDLPLTGYSSLSPLDAHVPFPVVKLPSIADLQRIPLFEKPIKYITNRTLGDSQILLGLEGHILGSDIAHVADPHYYYSYQAALLRASGGVRKLISTWWETIPFNNEGTAAKRNIKKYTMSQIDVFLCYTESAKSCLLKEGVDEKRISVIPLGVDLVHFCPAKKNTDAFTILFVGRLVAEKGILDLYKAYREIAKVTPSAQLHIVGSGPLEGELLKMIHDDNLVGRVTIEKKPYTDMPQVYQKADVLCVPSKRSDTWEEQLGMVFVEAMASGLPIISYATGAIPEIVGSAGILVNENNTQQLCVSIKQLIETRELLKKLGTMGRDRAEKLYDCKKTSQRILKLYETLNPGL